MKIRNPISAIMALSVIAASQAHGAQPVVVGPYVLLTTVLFNVDYAVSTGNREGQPSSGSDTIISIGLPSGAPTSNWHVPSSSGLVRLEWWTRGTFGPRLSRQRWPEQSGSRTDP